MLTLDEACNIAAQVTCPYVPGLQIHVGHAKHYASNWFSLLVAFEVPAVQNPSVTKLLQKHCGFRNTPQYTGYDFLLFISSSIKDLLAHELDEHLRFDGMFVKNPHPDVYDYPVIDKEMFSF